MIVARIDGTSIYGEAQSEAAALENLSENALEFVEVIHAVRARGMRIGGQVERDWNVLGPAASVTPQPAAR